MLTMIITGCAVAPALWCNSDRLEIGKWQNSTPHTFKTPKTIAKKLSWVIRSATQPTAPIDSQGSSGEMCVFLNYHS